MRILLYKHTRSTLENIMVSFSAAAATKSSIVWEFQKGAKWEAYDRDENNAIERAFKKNQSEIDINMGYRKQFTVPNLSGEDVHCLTLF